MKRRTILALFLIFLVLLVITFLQLQPRTLQGLRSDATPEIMRLTSMGPELKMTVLDIQAIRLRDPNTNQEFTISRDQQGNWTAPNHPGRLDTQAASNIAKTIVLMPFRSVVPLPEKPDLKQYGFSPGSFTIELVLRNRGVHAILFGSLSTSQDVYYTLVDDRPQVYLLERSPIEYLRDQLRTPPVTA
jgi:hypothetical protein